jgi:hypothetical protein
MKPLNFWILALFGALSCSSDSEEQPHDMTVTYIESMEDFPNPDRGFYHYSETSSSSFNSLSKSVLESYRMPKKSSGASYDVVSTLVFRYFVLEDSKDGPLSDDFLNKVKADFATARSAGVKLIPRFTYTVTATPGTCAEEFICPPYGDAPKNIVLQQISQLKSLFEENVDVISCVQMGFIGTWGENYYTDYFGDASSNDQGKLLDNNWQDRIEVLKALLDATPKEIMVQVRYPQIKQRLVYGISAAVTSASLTEAEAFSETYKARIGFHNDCFLASSDDFGTFEDYGNSSTPRASANTTLRKYFSEDSKYVPVGGETCSDGYSPQNDCEPDGKAQQEMKNLHYSFLNTDYNNQVNNDWVTGGCIESIKRNLGYRFVLRTATYPSVVKKGESLTVKIALENVGYASPFKAHPVELKLRNVEDGSIYTFTFDTDIRKWFPGNINLEESFVIPDVNAGAYELLLNIPDAHSTISERPEYSIRIANENVWEDATGFNKLNHTITIKN